MDNNDRTNIQADLAETETDTGHSELIEVEEERPKPVRWEVRQETRFRVVRLIQKKNYAMRRM